MIKRNGMFQLQTQTLKRGQNLEYEALSFGFLPISLKIVHISWCIEEIL